MKKKYSKLKCGFYSLLLLVFFSLNSCNIENIKTKSVEMTSKEIKAKSKTDSLTISVKLKFKESVILNYDNKYFENNTLKFTNNINRDTIVTRKILRLYNSQVFNYGHIQNLTTGFKRTSQNILIDKSIKKINFELRNNQLFPLKTNNDVLVSELINDYNLLYSKIYKSKGSFKLEIKNELDSLHKKYQKKYQSTNKLLHIQLNDFNYMSLLERLSPKNKAVDLFIQKVNFDVICGSFTDLGYQFVKHRINSLNYKKLNSNNYSDFYLKYIALSIYKFLKHKDNKGDQNFHESRDWLKTTEFYKKDSVYIKKQIQHLSNDLFKEKIKNLRLSSVALKESSLSKIIQKHPSPYYLIDFWATWCAPCISGIKEMKKMNFPKNVKILSLSVDKEEVKEKWQLKTKELEQNISYLIDNRIEENKEFLKFIELNSIPRYILIDKNMNLIDQSFLPPHDPQFLPKLKDVKNAKFW